MRVLGLDYGSARCGCAVADPTGTLVTPLEAIPRPATRRGMDALAALVAEREGEEERGRGGGGEGGGGGGRGWRGMWMVSRGVRGGGGGWGCGGGGGGRSDRAPRVGGDNEGKRGR